MPPAPKSLPNLPADYLPKFFNGDVVTRAGNESLRARVLRCWSEDEELPPPPLAPGEAPHPLDRPLLRGEVGISDTYTHDLSIVPESSLTLLQRDFIPGDIVKRSLTSVESAVVTSVETEVQLEHVMGLIRARGWTPLHKLQSSLAVEARSRVVYDEWIGEVEEVFEAAKIQADRRRSYWIAASGGLLEVGRTLAESFLPPEPMPTLPTYAHPDTDYVCEIHPQVVFVTWNAINQELPISEQEKHPEPPRSWRGEDIEKLTVIDTIFSSPVQLGTTVRFKDPADIDPAPTAWSFFAASINPREVPDYRITQARSRIKLRWGDGTVNEEWSSAIVPYRNVDDYESWPGDTLVWRDETGARRPACVQTFNPHQRVADVLFLDDNTQSTVSVLELDPGGPGKAEYGVGIGQTVLLCGDNGMELPQVPSLGQPSPMTDATHEQLERLVVEFSGEIAPPTVFLPKGDVSLIRWWGEVADLHLDGTVSVRLPAGDIRRVGVKQLILLNEPIAPEMMAAMGMDVDMLEETGLDGYDSDASWITEPDDDPPVIEVPESERDVEEVDPMVAESDDEITVDQSIQNDDQEMAEAGPSKPSKPANALLGDETWQSFDVLEEAPADHHYLSEAQTTPTKAYLTRLQREHRTLMTSLPENILVRTYEDRSDLLRVLIIGPQQTPYVDAPFIFDVHLNPSKFPNEPPAVFFHSHTNGHGRCNPNLYEDGKVCLSVLGTWAGEKSESWDPKNSSLLQVFVSISGLVLVRHPYHCEPAFAKLEGTREGQINSRLYSEKAYVLSRSFVRQALQHPPVGFEAELEHFYFAKTRLQSVIDHAKALMDKGDATAESQVVDQGEEIWSQDAMGSLTMGAILSLRRTVAALETIARDR